MPSPLPAADAASPPPTAEAASLPPVAGPVPLTPGAVRFQGSVWALRALSLLGWTLRFDGLPARQGVLVVYPHTSNWDFVIGVLAKWAMGMQASWWGKESLFAVPLFGRWLRWLGGLPVKRGAPQGAVGAMRQALVDARTQDRLLWLVLTPEGTRSAGAGWKSGFWRLATAAEVPLGLALMDFGRREVTITHFWRLSGDADADMAALAAAAAGVNGRRPDQAAPVRLLPASAPGAAADREQDHKETA